MSKVNGGSFREIRVTDHTGRLSSEACAALAKQRYYGLQYLPYRKPERPLRVFVEMGEDLRDNGHRW
jgi:hypothetical protein